MWVTKLLISPVKKRIFCPKNDPIWPEIGIFVHFGPGLAGSFGWWLWRAGCISQDTYLLYSNVNIQVHKKDWVNPEHIAVGQAAYPIVR